MGSHPTEFDPSSDPTARGAGPEEPGLDLPDDPSAGSIGASLELVMSARPTVSGIGRPRLESLRRALDQLELHRGPDVSRRLATAASVEDAARSIGAMAEQMRARLVVADMSHASGEVATGTRLALQVNRWAAEHGPRPLLARSHLVLSTVLEGTGDGAACLDHALRAVELLDHAVPRTRGNHLLRLADALAVVGSYDSARQRYREAERIFLEIGDLERQLSVLNNLADTEISAGDVAAAWTAAGELQELSARAGASLSPAFCDTIAKAMMGVGRMEAAEQVAQTGLERLLCGDDVLASTPAELLLTLACAQRRRGRLVQAQSSLDRCLTICSDRSLAAVRVDALGEQAELHAATGRFDRAFATHQLFYRETMRLTSHQRESAAHARQALYETAEARQAAARFWDQARSDPLTGLRNRRYVDEELPRRLEAAARSGPGVLAAIIDADHFKRVNDTRSHQTGDVVIAALAGLFTGAVDAWQFAGRPNPGFVARLGGEEFLLVLLHRDETAALAATRQLLRVVQDHDWRPMVGALPVTVSIGAALARPADTQLTLLGRADRHLYAAKEAGRNRVVADPARTGPPAPGVERASG